MRYYWYLSNLWEFWPPKKASSSLTFQCSHAGMSEGSIHKALRLRWADQKDWPPHVACFVDRGGMGLGSFLCRHAVLQVFNWGVNVFSHLGKWQIFRRRCSGYRDVWDRTKLCFLIYYFFLSMSEHGAPEQPSMPKPVEYWKLIRSYRHHHPYFFDKSCLKPGSTWTTGWKNSKAHVVITAITP